VAPVTAEERQFVTSYYKSGGDHVGATAAKFVAHELAAQIAGESPEAARAAAVQASKNACSSYGSGDREALDYTVHTMLNNARLDGQLPSVTEQQYCGGD